MTNDLSPPPILKSYNVHSAHRRSALEPDHNNTTTYPILTQLKSGLHPLPFMALAITVTAILLPILLEIWKRRRAHALVSDDSHVDTRFVYIIPEALSSESIYSWVPALVPRMQVLRTTNWGSKPIAHIIVEDNQGGDLRLRHKEHHVTVHMDHDYIEIDCNEHESDESISPGLSEIPTVGSDVGLTTGLCKTPQPQHSEDSSGTIADMDICDLNIDDCETGEWEVANNSIDAALHDPDRSNRATSRDPLAKYPWEFYGFKSADRQTAFKVLIRTAGHTVKSIILLWPLDAEGQPCCQGLAGYSTTSTVTIASVNESWSPYHASFNSRIGHEVTSTVIDFEDDLLAQISRIQGGCQVEHDHDSVCPAGRKCLFAMLKVPFCGICERTFSPQPASLRVRKLAFLQQFGCELSPGFDDLYIWIWGFPDIHAGRPVARHLRQIWREHQDDWSARNRIATAMVKDAYPDSGSNHRFTGIIVWICASYRCPFQYGQTLVASATKRLLDRLYLCGFNANRSKLLNRAVDMASHLCCRVHTPLLSAAT